VKARTAISHRAAAAFVLATALLSASLPVSAQTDEERAGARAAATEGAAAMSQQRWADAVDLFTRAESLVHAPPHLLYLGRAYLKLGKLVKARETFQKLTRESLAATAPKVFVSAQAEGATELAALEARVPTLKISLKGAPPNVVVTMDGVKVSPALVGVPLPVDPGEHKLQATAAGFSSGVVTITLKEGARGAVELELKQSAEPAAPPVAPPVTAPVAPAPQPQGVTPKPSEPAQAVPDPAPAAAQPQPKDSAPQPGKSSTLRTVSYVTMGAGLAGLVVGGVFAAKSHDKRVQGDDLCPGGTCKTTDKDKLDSLDSEATSAGQLATTGFAVGGAALAAGVVLFFVSGSKPAPARAAHHAPAVTPWLGLGSAGLRGSF
jgi:hypothetical protein